jgi:GNAT superfamily N-acetyltransferase
VSLDTVIAALQARNAAIIGITTAPTALSSYPASLNTADMPIALVWPKAADSRQNSLGDLRRSDRLYEVYVYVAPTAQGAGIAENLATGSLLLQRFVDAYANAADSDLIGGSPQATIKASEESPIRDSGLTRLEYAGVEYHGFRLQVGIYEKW